MKKLTKFLIGLLSICSLALGASACDVNVNINSGNSGSVSGGIDSISPDSSDADADTDGSDADTDTDSSDADTDTDGGSDETPVIEPITIAEALELCGEPGNITTERYYIRAIVKSVTNPQYGSLVIQDETGEIPVYGTYGEDGTYYDALTEKPYKGDEVLLSCILQNYNGTKEVKHAYIIEFKSNQGNVDESAYTDMSIAEARAAQEGDYVKVDGAVAQITYANGMKPSGVYLVDDTQSIYVYDTDLAGRVQVGDIVTILAEKDYWILEKEEGAAAKHGYNGCNQLTNVTVVSISDEDVSYTMDWVQETTVKEIMDTPATEDITTTIYKVNALVEERPGSSFTNYYFFDIDGETGSYTYTQCNGGDFEWVRAYHGKICTVLLSVINYKSTDSACVARFLPIAIYDEGYQFDTTKAGEYAVKYHALDQFESVYSADPAKEMVTSVSSELLGFEGATISYVSSDTDVVYFEEVEGKTIMHCVANGNATITITGTYNEKSYEATVNLVFIDPQSISCITVAEAIQVAPNNGDDSIVTVRGIVGPSVVNKNGFYLFGEDGSMIAVLVNDTKEFAGLEIGHEVILTGVRERYVKDDTSTFAGQTCIVDAVIDVNLYGNHEYSTAKFVTDKTVADFSALDITKDYSTTVFVLTLTVEVVETPYYTNLNLVSGNNKITLYCSSANQYSWLKQFAGQEVMVEIAACNWNDKKDYWRGCALAVYTEDGKLLNTLNFDTF